MNVDSLSILTIFIYKMLDFAWVHLRHLLSNRIERKKTRRIYVGDAAIGDGAPVVVQSMTNTPTANVEAT